MSWKKVYVVSLAVAGMLVTACAGQPTDPSGQPPDRQGGGGASAGRADPVDLIGSWTLSEVTGEGDSVIQIGQHHARVWRDCGILLASWRANTQGQFVAHVAGYSGDCGSTAVSTPDWLRRAVAFTVDGDARLLLDAQGQPTARLLPGAEPTPGPNLAPSEAEPPVVTDEIRRALAPAAPLPPELQPAGADALAGRWVPADGSTSTADTPYVELARDGGWRGSDGCNGSGGRWIAGPGGALLAVGGPSTLMACDNVPVGSWLSGASRAGLDGDVLVLLDAEAEELGRLRRP